jgi:hypothetical protein
MSEPKHALTEINLIIAEWQQSIGTTPGQTLLINLVTLLGLEPDCALAISDTVSTNTTNVGGNLYMVFYHNISKVIVII